LTVSCEHDSLLNLRPFNSKCWIVPAHTTSTGRRVWTGDVVTDFRIVFQSLISVGEASRNKKHPKTVGRKFDRDPLFVSRRVGSQVHCDVVQGSARTTNELSLLVR